MAAAPIVLLLGFGQSKSALQLEGCVDPADSGIGAALDMSCIGFMRHASRSFLTACWPTVHSVVRSAVCKGQTRGMKVVAARPVNDGKQARSFGVFSRAMPNQWQQPHVFESVHDACRLISSLQMDPISASTLSGSRTTLR